MIHSEFFQRLRRHLSLGLPFAVYRKPSNQVVRAVLQATKELYTSRDFSESGFVFSPFDPSRQTVLFPESHCTLIECSGWEVGEEISRVQAMDPTDEVARNKHMDLVRKAILKIRQEDLEKVVLSRRKEISLKQPDPIRLFQNLLWRYPTAMVYTWFHPEVGLWLGATPETLLKVRGRQFETIALAGTQRAAEQEEVQWGAKEKQEQYYVTRAIEENLSPQIAGALEKRGPYTSRAGDLLHLRTDLKGRLHQEVSLGEILQALHPTPAICGYPREAAREFIRSEEGYDREFYTGFLGEINLHTSHPRSQNRRNVENLAYRSLRKESELYVNLRCMQLKEDQAFLYIGGGITVDSDPEEEWQETENKSRTMKEVLPN